MNDNEDKQRKSDGRELSNPGADVPPKYRGIDFGGVLAGMVGGLALGVAIIFIQLVCSSAVTAHFPQSRNVEFGSPTDRAGSVLYLAVQLAFLASSVGIVAVGISLAKRRPTLAAVLVVAALTLALPATACTLGAWTNARAALAP
jgi:hypothetical protein